MSTLGKVCLVLTLLLLLLAVLPIPGVWGGWTPKLLVLHSQWAEKFRDGKDKAIEAELSHDKARQEESKAEADVESLMIGWDRVWTIPARGPETPADASTISKSNGRLQLTNLGTADGLVTRQVQADDGSQKMMSPVIHAFYGGPEGFTYVGEFTAEDITNSTATLVPAHYVNPQEANSWPVNSTWRLRALIPPASRLTVDDLYAHYQRTSELTAQCTANIKRQQQLLAAAEEAHDVRRGELLGNPNREAVPTRPEVTEGLLAVIEQLEEERNQLLLDMDSLRRSIQAAVSDQQDTIDELKQKMKLLPGADSISFSNVNETAAAQ